jgi:ATP-dependent RNA helicase SUPV3L1/SUV3
MGIIPRGEVAAEVKALDQEARGALRKHGIRFGQFTVFMPALLKPAPTRLRLVLWSLAQGLDHFPESPPPGLVTVPATGETTKGYHSMAGYRAAGERAIRIDMLERLADMLRAEDSRAGFEAKADMLSITGTTLEQFADLMQGLGYKAERGEREKVKPVDQAVTEAPVDAAKAAEDTPPETLPDSALEAIEEIADQGEAPIIADPEAAPEVPPEISEAPEEDLIPGETPETAAPEIEVYYTFTWAPRAGRAAEGARAKPRKPQGQGKPGGKFAGKSGTKPGAKGKPQDDRGKKPAERPKKEERIDPDNPFAAALMGLKTKR